MMALKYKAVLTLDSSKVKVSFCFQKWVSNSQEILSMVSKMEREFLRLKAKFLLEVSKKISCMEASRS